MLKERKLTVRTAAEGPVKVIMKELNTSLRGLDPETVMENRSRYGTNKVTHEKKKSLLSLYWIILQRLVLLLQQIWQKNFMSATLLSFVLHEH